MRGWGKCFRATDTDLGRGFRIVTLVVAARATIKVDTLVFSATNLYQIDTEALHCQFGWV